MFLQDSCYQQAREKNSITISLVMYVVIVMDAIKLPVNNIHCEIIITLKLPLSRFILYMVILRLQYMLLCAGSL